MNPLRLLVLADSAVDAPLVQKALEEAGFDPRSCVVTSHGEYEAALTAAAWDLVIVDHNLPGFVAARALETLERSRLDIPLIIAGGTASEEGTAGSHDARIHGLNNRDLEALALVVQRTLRAAGARRASSAADPSAERRHPSISLGERILLVEDEASVRYVMRRALERAGYVVIEAATPTEALDLVDSKEPPRIDLLLTDLVMPGMSGPELAQRITTRAGDLPTLFVSGYTSEEVLARGIVTPDTPFLSKPFSFDKLLYYVRETINARAQRLEASGAAATPRRLPIGELTILLVDDNTGVRRATRRTLESEGCVVVEATNAHEALQSLERTRPDVVIMDLGLPAVEGREAAELILARIPTVPILYVSGYTSRESMRQPREQDGFLRKPFDGSELVAAIARLIPVAEKPPG